jgi:hypothetical protein
VIRLELTKRITQKWIRFLPTTNLQQMKSGSQFGLRGKVRGNKTKRSRVRSPARANLKKEWKGILTLMYPEKSIGLRNNAMVFGKFLKFEIYSFSLELQRVE